jgi:transposase
MMNIATVGLDLAKNVFQLYAVDVEGRVVLRRRLRRSEVVRLFARLPPCLVGMEACAGAHHLGREARLMPPAYVKAYVRRQKNDMADAAAICEAVTRPSMRFVLIKSEAQQALLLIHRARPSGAPAHEPDQRLAGASGRVRRGAAERRPWPKGNAIFPWPRL